MTGYAVAKPGHVSRQGAPVWFGGGKLAADLTLPKLRERWLATGPASTRRARPGAQLGTEERRRIWNGASNTAARAARTIRSCAFTDPAAAADAAWAASDALHIAADILGSGTLRQAADSYARAARCGYGRIPRLAPAGRRLRATARLLVLAVTVDEQDQAAAMMLVAKLAELAIAVAELRDIQRHAAQASAARTAAERLHAATCAGPSLVRPANARPAVRPHRRVRTAANLARLDFPNAFTVSHPEQPLVRAHGKKRPSRLCRVVPPNHEGRVDLARRTSHIRPDPGAAGRRARHTAARAMTVKSKI